MKKTNNEYKKYNAFHFENKIEEIDSEKKLWNETRND